jgi:hypothetical protein
MNAFNIKDLLNRYYNGQTTEAEEEELNKFFLEGDVSEDMEEDRAFFLHLQESRFPLPKGLGNRLSHQIDEWNIIEKNSIHHARIISIKWIGGIAACILLIFSIGLFTFNRTDEQEYARQQDTYSNPQDAYAETQRALMKFSKSINKGLAKVEETTNKEKD